MSGHIIVHGLDLSYFTGKIEAYLRAKGLAYELRPMTVASMRSMARQTGVAQMPQLELPSGDWLTDTPRIIDHFEASLPEPSISPADPAALFISHLMEDYGDEWLWRPALYYRWAFSDDMKLMGKRIAEDMLRTVPLPLALKASFIRDRQKRVYMRQDGITKETAPAVEALYLETLDDCEGVFTARPYLLGERPTRADFGLFGSLFRHFFSDPTPSRIMRARAPATVEWVARMWATTPARFEQAAQPQGIPDRLGGFAEKVSTAFLPYCQVNAASYALGEKMVSWRDREVSFSTPVNGYRVWRLARLQNLWRTLTDETRAQVAEWLGPRGTAILDGPAPERVPDLPRAGTVRDRTLTTQLFR